MSDHYGSVLERTITATVDLDVDSSTFDNWDKMAEEHAGEEVTLRSVNPETGKAVIEIKSCIYPKDELEREKMDCENCGTVLAATSIKDFGFWCPDCGRGIE